MQSLNLTLTNDVAEINGTPFDPKDDTQLAMLFLIGAGHEGINPDRIARRTGMNRRDCRRLAADAKSKGLISGGKLLHGGWHDDETGCIAFICDALVLSGHLDRARSNRGEEDNG